MVKFRKILVLVLALLFSLFCGFRTTNQLVYDYAGLLDSGKDYLQQQALEVSDSIQMQVVIVTSNDVKEGKTREYVDHFGYEQGFGYTKNDANYIVYCIDMSNRQIYISTSGEAISKVTDDEVDEILDQCKSFATSGDYVGSCQKFLEIIGDYVTNNNYDDSITGHFDPETGKYLVDEPSYVQKVFSLFNILASMIIGAIVSIIVVAIMKRNSSSRMTADGLVYQKGNVKVHRIQDRFIRETVTKRKIQRESSSGGGSSSFHTDSSGSHGGGGTSF
ncbi:hypothetical protein P261_01928 [Lachnospiraceae bacterium TWA4]|nr:hypothetical protein P261_01928 [Lachnospiraceae bacterium TWA4]